MLKNSTKTRQVELDRQTRQTRLMREIHTADNLFIIKLLQELQRSINKLEVQNGKIARVK
jgi:hypothetical protein